MNRIRSGGTILCLLAAMLTTPEMAISQSVLRVVSYNIKHSRGMDDQIALERIANVLRRLDADVITLQEVDNRTERTNGVDQVEVLAGLLGYQGFHGAHRSYQGGEYGNAILTRIPVQRVRTHSIPPASGSRLTVHEVVLDLREGAVCTDPLATTSEISIVSVHLAGTPEERLSQADSITSYFRNANHPVVLAGDFNGRPGGPVLERLSKDWGILKKSSAPETYPSPAPNREIDFIMLRPESNFEVIEHRVIDEPAASDHRPILAVVRVR